MRVDDLACHGLADPNVTGEAAILPAGIRVGEMLFETPVAADAEVCLLDWAETEAVVIVVARCAQATAQFPRRRVADEPSALRGRRGEPISA
jgi:hypothetical protein